jgi:hypothetical protein
VVEEDEEAVCSRCAIRLASQGFLVRPFEQRGSPPARTEHSRADEEDRQDQLDNLISDIDRVRP